MFRKLVSSLPYSPALAGELGRYAGTIRREQFVRRLGLLFVVAALVIQGFAVLNPPVQASANSNAAIIPNGVTSVQDIVSIYDAGIAGHNDFSSLMSYMGITRSDLQALSQSTTSVCSSDHSVASFSRQHHFSSSEGELVHHVPTSSGSNSTFYSVPLYRFDQGTKQTDCYNSYIGHSAKIGWFAIMQKCGNLMVKQNTLSVPRAHLADATCSAVDGFAYDERGLTQNVKVYIFIGGPPGEGEQYGPVVANSTLQSSPVGTGHGFALPVPDQYQNSTNPVPVWAVMQPLAGWTEPMVQADNTLEIPAHCSTSRTPVVTCNALEASIMDRTTFSFATNASTSGGGTVQGYEYTVTGRNGKVVFDKLYTSTDLSNTSDPINLKDAGSYTVRATVKTGAGANIQSAACTNTFVVATTSQCQYQPTLSATDSACQPCPYQAGIWEKANDCSPHIALSKEAFNLSQGNQNANGTTAAPGDRIQYNLHTTNVGSAAVATPVSDNVNDLLDYSTVIDTGGGTLDTSGQTVSWGNVMLTSGQSDNRSFVIQVNDTIAATPRAANDPASYDCVITNSYGNTTNIAMRCPLGKTIESTIRRLPAMGLYANAAFAAILLTVSGYFYIRSRQLARELRIIRREFNGGTL